MKIPYRPATQGIAIIMVMVVVFVLTILVGGFAYSMKIEMRLAQNHGSETELEWLGRSGVELARYVLAQQMMIPGQRFDALNQKWAGGIGVTNESLMDISLDDVPLGSGVFSVKIIDQERKLNVNLATDVILKQATTLIGVDAAESSTIVDSILDWVDRDEDPHLSGTESDYYLTLSPPYYAKNGPIDDITELLLVNGVTPELFWGPSGTNRSAPVQSLYSPNRELGRVGQVSYPVGFYDLFSTLSGRQININTASAIVLQLIPMIDENMANSIIMARAGPDGVEGNEDDMPFRHAAELRNVPGVDQRLLSDAAKFFTVNSGTFEVQVDARIGNYRRQYIAMLRRNNPRDIQILYFYWR